MNRTPRGVRGLKQLPLPRLLTIAEPHPSRGAWIETLRLYCPSQSISNRTPRGVRGLKPADGKPHPPPGRPHPSRGAWIETLLYRRYIAQKRTAPLAGCVD